MVLYNQKNIVIAVAILLVAAVAGAAWIHNSESHPLAAPVAEYTAAPPAPGSAAGYYPTVPRPAYIREPDIESNIESNIQPDVAVPVSEVPAAAGPYREYRHSRSHQGRSKKHSVEIVAGTAAAGAAIGAIAGGGKGAALGGISGAGAGFIYDRLTHNH
jgi:hypothetical protein